jgi:DNA-binding NarL/FixJ family response regulator
MRILIADDHPVVRRGLRDLLRQHTGWEVCAEAADGMEALALAREVSPHLAVLDVAMPRLNGVEATRKIRDAVPGIEVLLYTVHDSDQLAAEAAQAGARGYVLKSQPAADLIAAVEAVANARGALLHGAAPRSADSNGSDRSPLTPRQREIVQLVAEGRSNKEMSRMLGISVRTIETHRSHIMQKLRLTTRAELVRYALQQGLLEEEPGLS